jgi:hypothetical protein
MDLLLTNFQSIDGRRRAIYGSETDTLRMLLESFKTQMNFSECRAFINGVEATDETLDRTAVDLRLCQYNCVVVVGKPKDEISEG